MVSYNHQAYQTFIRSKHDYSERHFQRVYSSEPAEEFLMAYDAMNVFPIYPRPIVVPIKKSKDDWAVQVAPGEVPLVGLTTSAMRRLSGVLRDKLEAYQGLGEEFAKLRNADKIRRFFDYEIRDALRAKLRGAMVTNAWCKMYELLSTYKLFDAVKDDTIRTFHICEHPGAFIHATAEYVKRLGKRHQYVFQSLKPGSGLDAKPTVFRADRRLDDKLVDYGLKGTGDITDADNVLYYARKYRKNRFHLITSDCGLDCSDDLSGQEAGLYKIFLGALIAAVSVAAPGAHYVMKMFSFDNDDTVELLLLASKYFERVDVVRLLTDKSGSGEVYLVCLNFLGASDAEVRTLTCRLTGECKRLTTSPPPRFLRRVERAHETMTLRRLTNMNMLMFRFYNNAYVDAHPEVKLYVKHLARYYTQYFLTYVGL